MVFVDVRFIQIDFGLNGRPALIPVRPYASQVFLTERDDFVFFLEVLRPFSFAELKTPAIKRSCQGGMMKVGIRVLSLNELGNGCYRYILPILVGITDKGTDKLFMRAVNSVAWTASWNRRLFNDERSRR